MRANSSGFLSRKTCSRPRGGAVSLPASLAARMLSASAGIIRFSSSRPMGVVVNDPFSNRTRVCAWVSKISANIPSRSVTFVNSIELLAARENRLIGEYPTHIKQSKGGPNSSLISKIEYPLRRFQIVKANQLRPGSHISGGFRSFPYRAWIVVIAGKAEGEDCAGIEPSRLIPLVGRLLRIVMRQSIATADFYADHFELTHSGLP